MKNMKVTVKLQIGFSAIGVLLLLLLYSGYSTAAKITSLEAERQKEFLSSYATFSAVIFIVMTIIMVTFSLFMTRMIKNSTRDLKVVADALTAGDVTVEINKRNNDEFGALMDDFQLLVNNTRYQAEVAQHVSEGDLTVNVAPKSEKDVMGNALKQVVIKNRKTLTDIKEAAYQVTTSSSQVASASEALAQGSTEQASAIEEITASINDVAEKTKQNASQANAAADMMAKMIVEVQKGNEEMQNMVVAMGEINSASENISKIIKVIDDIAFQTNILALNAAVEAARAGDAGKGFAVVAEEVRNLAAKSAAAAAETAEMIEDSIRKVEAGANIAHETERALALITDEVRHSEKIVNEIAEASSYQATAIAQIDKAIGQVSQVVQTNSATSEECAAASVELSNQASRMRNLISVYKLGDDKDGYVDEMKVTSRHYSSFDNEKIISLGEGFGKY